MSQASSNCITSSTTSSESAPRSSWKLAPGVTSASSTCNCSTMICLTFSSTAMRISPRDFQNLGIFPGLARSGSACPAYRVTAGEHNHYARKFAHGPEIQVYRADGEVERQGVGNREQGIENGLIFEIG